MSIKDKINAFFNSENLDLEVKETAPEVEETKNEKFEDVTLADGTVLMVEPALEVGAAVVITVDGEMMPAPDGDHVLADNSIISVEGGLITNIAPAEEVEEEVVEELDSEATATVEKEREAKKVIESIVTEKQFSDLTKEVEELKKSNDFLKKDNEAIQAKYTEDFKELGELFKELFKEPTKEPIKTVKNPLKKESRNIFLATKKNK
jgi:hypothetical protein